MKKTLLAAAVFVSLSFPLFSHAALDTNLKYGSSGSTVTELQEFLTAQGVYSGPITGNFYSLTLAGVKAFQTREAINPISGFWGPLSRARAQAMLDISDSNSDEQTQTGGIGAPSVAPAPVVDTQTQAQLNALTTQVTNLNAQLQNQSVIQQQIANNTQTMVTNSTPVVTPPVVEAEPTIEGCIYNCSANEQLPTFSIGTQGYNGTQSQAIVLLGHVQSGDKITLTFDGNTKEIIAQGNAIRGQGWDAGWRYYIQGLTVGNQYSYSARVERGNYYGVASGIITAEGN